MKIEYGAFQNCVSLKEIHFEKCNEAINTNIYNSHVPDDLKIIVNDNLYEKSLKTEYPANHYRLQRYSDYLQDKLNLFENSYIIQSIILIRNVLDQYNIDFLKNIEIYLIEKYQINENNIKHIIDLKNKIQEKIKNGSQF